MASWVFETVDASVMDNGVMTAGICGDDHDALLTLLKEPYRWPVPEGSAQEQPDEEAPLSLLYDPLRPINFADTGGTWSGFEQQMWMFFPLPLHYSVTRLRKVQLLKLKFLIVYRKNS